MFDINKYSDLLTVEDDATDEDLLEYQKELDREMEEAINICKNAPNDRFPEFLFEPMVNEFESDNYIERAVYEDNELTQSVKMLRRKYNNIYDYYDALDVYRNYKEYLSDKYGNWKIAKNGILDGVLPDYLPAKPKLKNNKKNRILLEAKILPSRKDEDIAISYYDLDDTINKMFPQTSDDIDDTVVYKFKTNKKLQKAIDREMGVRDKKYRKAHIYNTSGASDALDAIINFMNNRGNLSSYDESGKHVELDSVSAYQKEMHRDDFVDPALLEARMESEFDNRSYISNGTLRNKAYENQMQILEVMMKNGVDITDIASRSMDKRAVRMLKSKIDNSTDHPLSRKEIRKMNKKKRKEYQKNLKKMTKEAELRELLLKNKMPFSRDPGTLSFKLSDLWDDDL